MSGYTRQSAADIVPTAVVRAAPINNELNAVRDAFDTTGGHKHDGTSAEGHPVPVIGDSDLKNKVAVDTATNRVGVFVEVATVSTEQVRVVDGAIVPVTDNDIDLGSAAAEFKDLYIDGTANIDALVADTADINGGTIDATVIGASSPAAATVTTIAVNSSATIASADINAGTIDGAVIGAASAQAITGTLITASTGFAGPITGAVTGNVTGNLTGNVTGNVTGNLTGNVTATVGSSSFNDVTITGTLNMDSGTVGTITNLATPTNSGDAATKGYVDTADALKLNLSGGTMSGALAMGTNKITGLGTPTSSADASTKGYVDTAIANLIDTAPGTLDTLNELAAALGDDPNFATTVTNDIATKLPLAGGTMTGAIAMSTNKITGLGTPTTTADAATKGYVDTADALKLNLSGGTMSGQIAMGTNKITGLGDPTLSQDATTKTYVDTADALKLNLTGGTMSGAIAMGTNKITGLGTPTADTDASTKVYVDGILGSATSAATSAAAAAVSETNALNSANSASSSATTATGAANSAVSAYDSFDDRYLGVKTVAPTLDNDGNPLAVGTLYYNTTGTPQIYIWNGTSWDPAAFNATGVVASFNTRQGAVTLLSSDVTGALGYTPVDKAVSNTFNGTQTFNTAVATTATLTNGTISTTPSGSTDLVNKSYVDTAVGAAAAGIHFHSPVRVEAPTNLTATYNNGTAGVGATLTNSGTQAALVIDGITLALNNRVLIYTQTNPAHNGVYIVSNVGSVSTNWVLTRATDADTYGEGSNLSLDQGSYFFVTEGNTGAGESYVCTTVGAITFGTTAINFVQFSASKAYLAGTGLTLTNATFSITNTGTAGTYGSATVVPRITTNAQGQVTGVVNTTIAIPSTAVSGLATSATTDTTNASNITTGVLGIGVGGTGATTAALARTNLGATTLGSNVFTVVNPNAITFPRFNADNTISTLDAATFRTAIGAGTSSTTGTVTSVGGTGTVSGLTLTGTVTTTGNLTLGGTLAVTPSNFASQTANTILAAPNGVAGVPTFRAIVAADVPTLNQNTTGTAGNVTGIVAVANGGTGVTSSTGSTSVVLSTAPTITGLRETRVAMGASNIDLNAGNYFTRTISGATSLTVSNVPASGTAASFILDLTNGGSGTITWFTGTKWAGGVAPTLTTSGRDILGFFTHDGGTTWNGLLLGKDVK